MVDAGDDSGDSTEKLIIQMGAEDCAGLISRLCEFVDDRTCHVIAQHVSRPLPSVHNRHDAQSHMLSDIQHMSSLWPSVHIRHVARRYNTI